jgi:hypothetical protein
MAESVSKRGSEREKTESPPLPLLLEVPKRAAAMCCECGSSYGLCGDMTTDKIHKLGNPTSFSLPTDSTTAEPN